MLLYEDTLSASRNTCKWAKAGMLVCSRHINLRQNYPKEMLSKLYRVTSIVSVTGLTSFA